MYDGKPIQGSTFLDTDKKSSPWYDQTVVGAPGHVSVGYIMKNDDSPQTLWWLRTYDSYELENASWEIQFKIDFAARNVRSAEFWSEASANWSLNLSGRMVGNEWKYSENASVIIPNKTWLIAKGDPQLISVSEPFANYALKNEVATWKYSKRTIHELRSRGRVFSSSEL